MFEIKRIACENTGNYVDLIVEIKINNKINVVFSRNESEDLIAGTNINKNENYSVVIDKIDKDKHIRRGTDNLSLKQANDILAMICEFEK